VELLLDMVFVSLDSLMAMEACAELFGEVRELYGRHAAKVRIE
jgi:hypothetical protein